MPFDFKCYRCNHLALENQQFFFRLLLAFGVCGELDNWWRQRLTFVVIVVWSAHTSIVGCGKRIVCARVHSTERRRERKRKSKRNIERRKDEYTVHFVWKRKNKMEKIKKKVEFVSSYCRLRRLLHVNAIDAAATRAPNATVEQCAAQYLPSDDCWSPVHFVICIWAMLCDIVVSLCQRARLGYLHLSNVCVQNAYRTFHFVRPVRPAINKRRTCMQLYANTIPIMLKRNAFCFQQIVRVMSHTKCQPTAAAALLWHLRFSLVFSHLERNGTNRRCWIANRKATTLSRRFSFHPFAPLSLSCATC